jgi:uncharacterized alpha/beta hydrolase family protein
MKPIDKYFFSFIILFMVVIISLEIQHTNELQKHDTGLYLEVQGTKYPIYLDTSTSIRSKRIERNETNETR